MDIQKLAQKITSVEELSAAGVDVNAIVYAVDYLAGHFNTSGVAWWAMREYARIQHGLYYVPSVLAKPIFKNVFAHASVEDKTMIAFTPDKASGEADRQLKMAPGRFFSRMLPVANDNHIQELTAEYLAEVSEEIEWITGSEIVKAYGQFGGVAACMSKSMAAWPSNNGHHPCSVYDMPHIKLAVLRGNDGQIKERSLVYEASPTDKRWIRCYPPNSKLIRMLEREGYKKGNFVGAELKRIDLAANSPLVRVVLPYLDGNGTVGSERYSSVALLDGKLKVVSYEAAQQLREMNRDYVTFGPTTYGNAVLREVDLSSLSYVDVFDGLTKNKLESTPVTFYYEGVEYEIAKENKNALITLVHELEQQTLRLAYDGRGGKTVLARSSETFYYAGDYFVDTNTNRRSCGFIQLDQRFYGSEWARRNSALHVELEGSDTYIRKEDCIVYIDENDKVIFMHVSEQPKGAVKLHKVSKGYHSYLAHKNAKFVKTRSGRKVHKETHSVVELTDGTYELSRNVKTIYMGSANAYFSLKDSNAYIVEHMAAAFNRGDRTLINGLTRWLEDRLNVVAYPLRRADMRYFHENVKQLGLIRPEHILEVFKSEVVYKAWAKWKGYDMVEQTTQPAATVEAADELHAEEI